MPAGPLAALSLWKRQDNCVKSFFLVLGRFFHLPLALVKMLTSILSQLCLFLGLTFH
jgi:hypothetical protein